jgi:hypothetical protein
MDHKKLDEQLLCQMVARVAPLFDGRDDPISSGLEAEQAGRILTRVKVRIAAQAATACSPAAVARDYVLRNLIYELQADAPAVPLRAAPLQPSRLAIEELEPRDPTSCLSRVDADMFRPARSTWEVVRAIPELVCSYVGGWRVSPEIAVLW